MDVFLFGCLVLGLVGGFYMLVFSITTDNSREVSERTVYILCLILLGLLGFVSMKALQARNASTRKRPVQPEIQITIRPDSTADTLYIYKFE